jgi:hypothetical protein
MVVSIIYKLGSVLENKKIRLAGRTGEQCSPYHFGLTLGLKCRQRATGQGPRTGEPSPRHDLVGLASHHRPNADGRDHQHPLSLLHL